LNPAAGRRLLSTQIGAQGFGMQCILHGSRRGQSIRLKNRLFLSFDFEKQFPHPRAITLAAGARIMALPHKDGAVGYKRPPEHTRWKKGQCGNPMRQYRRASKGTLELIDKLFGEQITIVENGVSRRLSVFQAIVLQLWRKEMAGDQQALAVRLKYQEFVAQQRGPPEIIIEAECEDGVKVLRMPDARDGRL
jgi:hypothetical protein